MVHQIELMAHSVKSYHRQLIKYLPSYTMYLLESAHIFVGSYTFLRITL